MTFEDIKEFALALGIQSVEKFDKVEELIRTIQLAEGNTDCFAKIPDCNLTNCAWFDDCAAFQGPSNR